MSLRQVIFWVHLAIGVSAALVVLMMAVTGVILAYEAQLNRSALRGYRVPGPPPNRSPLGVDEVLALGRDASPQTAVTTLTVSSDTREPVVIGFEGGDRLYVDPFTGAALGSGDTRTRRVLRIAVNLHRWFALEGEYRIIGRTITATANVGFLFLVVSGAYLWCPRTWTRRTWSQAAFFRRGLRGRARDFNWHSVVGFWTAVPLAIIVASGVTISYQWAGNLVYRLVGETPPPGGFAAESIPVAEDPVGAPRSTDGDPVTLQALVTTAATEQPRWRTMSLELSDTAAGLVTVTVDRGTGRQPAKTEDLVFDSQTGRLVARGGYPTFSRGLKMRRWLRFAHTGEVYGVMGQSIAGLASLGAAVLACTGLAMAWRRLCGRTRDTAS